MALKTVPQPKRQIQLPTQDLTRPQDQSTITGGGGVSTVYTPKNVLTPPSISNPASLNPATKSVSPAVSQTTTTGLSKPAGYEGVAKPVYTPGVSQIDNTGKDVTSTVGLAKPAVPTQGQTVQAGVSGQLTSDQSQAVQNQAVAQGLDSNILDDPNNYAQMGISEADFNNLPPEVRLKMLEEKKSQIGITQDTLKQLEAVETIERQKQYYQAQEANRLEQEAINANIAGVQASQRLKDASKNVDNLKQNAGFLGTGGRPVKSQASIDAMGNSINEAQTTFQIMKNTEDQFAMLRGLQTESQAKAFEENMARLDDQLKAQTSSLFLKAYLDYQKEANSGKLDTPKKILEFQQRMLNTVDDSLEGITQNQLSQVNALIEAGKTYAEQMKAQTEREQKLADEKRQNARKTDMERSKAMGVLLDGNGDPILTPAGQEIPVPKDLPPGVTAIRDEVGGFVRIPKMNADGTIGYDKVKAGTPSPTSQLDLELKRLQVLKAQQDLGGTITTPTTTPIDLIKRWEGFRDKAYQDSAGVWTIGYGFTNVGGKPVQPGQTMDRATADAMLQDEVAKRQNYMQYITVPLNENQKAALSSFEYNLGSGIRDKNAMPILNKINQGDLQGAATLMKQYVNAGGKPIQGLVNRRNEEAKLLTTTPQEAPSGTTADDNILYGLAKKLIETGGFEPKDVTALGYDLNTFKQKALSLYEEGKNKELAGYGATLVDPQTFISADSKRKTDAISALSQLEQIKTDISDYKDLIKENGAELTSWSDAGDKLEQLKNSMALTLKEVKNLGVLNGKDYEILLTQIPSAVSIKKWIGLGASLETLVDNFERGLTDKVNVGLKSIGVQYGIPQEQTKSGGISSDRQ